MATKSSTLEVDRTINAAQRTLSILNAFLTRDGPLTLGDLESETGLFKSVILRYMLSLEPDYVTRRQDGRYQLGPRVYQLGCRYEDNFDFSEYVTPVLDWLTEKTGESSAFYVQEGDSRLCLLRKDSPQHLKASVPPGTSLPLDDTSTSQVLRQFNDGRRVSWRPEEVVRISSGIPGTLSPSMQHICSLAVPVFRTDNVLAGALMIAGPIFRLDPEAPEIQAWLIEGAQSISRQLGWR